MKKILLTLTLMGMALTSFSQDQTSAAEKSNWTFNAVGGLNGTHASFKNWNAGGQNTLSWIALFDSKAVWAKDKYRWENGLNLAYGQNRVLRTDWAKTDDVIALYSKFGYQITKPLDFSLLVDFKSQFDVSRSIDGNKDILSKFMAPGYLTLGIGLDYHPNKKFQTLFMPLTGKITYVYDYTLSQAGAFGVTPGENIRRELGAFAKILYTDEVMKNVTFKGRLELFSAYDANFITYTDVAAEVLFDFKINKWVVS